MKTSVVILNLTDEEIALLRQSVNELGNGVDEVQDNNCVSLQLKVANAILDSDYLRQPKTPYEMGRMIEDHLFADGPPGVRKSSRIKKGKK